MSHFKKQINGIKPREKFLISGGENLSDAELLAIILQSGTKNKSVVTLCNEIIEKHGGVDILLTISFQELVKFEGIGQAKALKIMAVGEIFKRSQKNYVLKHYIYIKKPEDAFNYLKGYFSKEQELFFLICLDTKNKIISHKVLFIGILNSIVIHPRDIFKEAILQNSYKIIIAHNHPSSELLPSQPDINVTQKIIYLGRVMGIELLDHIIFSATNYYSFGEKKPALFTELDTDD